MLETLLELITTLVSTLSASTPDIPDLPLP